MRKKLKNFYQSLVTIPETLYPFSIKSKVGVLHGQKAYAKRLTFYRSRLGPGHIGYRLFLYRQFFHFLGSILFIISATLISKSLFGSRVALYILLIIAVCAISYQEFYLHPRLYKQLWTKSVGDWLSWIVPIGLYIFMIL